MTLRISASCDWVQNTYIDAEGVFTVYAEQVCSYSIYNDGFDPAGVTAGDPLGGGGGGGGDPSGAPAVSNLPGEDSPSVDPAQYMKCFGGIPDAGATMTVTVYVQEPWPGTTFNIGPNSVGHTAVSLTKSNGSSSVTQTLGFYPNASGLNKLHASSKLADNSGLNYNVSISYTVSAAQFAAVTNYIANPPGTYDLTVFNCTDFAIGACRAGGITLPDASSPTGFYGPTLSVTYANTPAALGSSIQNMQGQPGVNTGGGNVPQSKGSCN